MMAKCDTCGIWESDPDPEAKVFFDSITDVLMDFAKKYKLVVHRYHRGYPGWWLSFRHPLNGVVDIRIDLATGKLSIGADWYVYKFKEYKRYEKSIKIWEGEKESMSKEELRKILLQALKTMYCLKEEDLDECRDYKGTWKGKSQKELEKIYYEDTMVPILDNDEMLSIPIFDYTAKKEEIVISDDQAIELATKEVEKLGYVISQMTIECAREGKSYWVSFSPKKKPPLESLTVVIDGTKGEIKKVLK